MQWEHDLVKEFDNELDKFGLAQSPVIHENLVIVAANTPRVGVVAYDRASGNKVWESPGVGMHSYVSPQVMALCGEPTVIAVGSTEEPPKGRQRGDTPPKELVQGYVVGISPKDGSVLWKYDGLKCRRAIPYPLQLDGDRLFITGGYDAGSMMIELKKADGKMVVNELFKTDVVGSQTQQPIRIGDYIYIGSNTNSRKDGLACIDLNGKLMWRTKDIDGAPNFDKGGLILVDGKLIMMDAPNGILRLIKPSPEGYREMAAAQLVKEGDMNWAPLVLSEGRLIVRDWSTMKCVDLR